MCPPLLDVSLFFSLPRVYEWMLSRLKRIVIEGDSPLNFDLFPAVVSLNVTNFASLSVSFLSSGDFLISLSLGPLPSIYLLFSNEPTPAISVVHPLPHALLTTMTNNPLISFGLGKVVTAARHGLMAVAFS